VSGVEGGVLLELGIILVAIALGSFVKGVTGSGLPQIAIPVMAIFLGVERAVVLMAIPGPPVLEPSMRACHDISVFVPLRLAAAACAEQAQLWRVMPNGLPDTENPLWVYDDTVDETDD
jgi:hypothetical protein